NEDTPHAFAAADFSFTDSNDNPPNNLQSVIIESLPAHGTLTLNGNPVFANDEIAPPDLAGLSYAPGPNYFGTDSFTFAVRDDGGTNSGGVDTSATMTMSITVNPVNDAPSFTAGADQAVNEDAGPVSVTGWATNISDGPLESNQTLNFQVA